jgi:hypothetical protein
MILGSQMQLNMNNPLETDTQQMNKMLSDVSSH